MHRSHSVDGMDLEVGENAGNPFAVAPVSKRSNELPGALTPTALPPALAKLRRTYEQTMGSASHCAITDCNAGHATSLTGTVPIPTTHVPEVGDLHDAFFADHPVLASATEG